MKIYTTYILLLMLMTAFSCEEEKDCCVFESDELIGTWLLYEHGYSPGDRYITEAVPDSPPQKMIFQSGNKFVTTIENLSEYKFYVILHDGESDKILALFKIDPGTKALDIQNLEHAYTIQKNADRISLHYRYCIEGCHLGLKRI